MPLREESVFKYCWSMLSTPDEYWWSLYAWCLCILCTRQRVVSRQRRRERARQRLSQIAASARKRPALVERHDATNQSATPPWV